MRVGEKAEGLVYGKSDGGLVYGKSDGSLLRKDVCVSMARLKQLCVKWFVL